MINFSSISKNSLLGGLFRHFLKIIPNSIVVPVLQGRLRGKKWIKGSGVNGYWLGSYENDQVNVFEKNIKNRDIFFDIGANVGFYSLLAAEIVGPLGKVFSFEPFPENFKYLKKHIEINKYKNIFPYQIAVSDKNGIAFFGGVINRSQGRLVESGELKVETIKLDDWIDNEKLPIPNVLKIDVEGAEFLVLKGLENILKKFHPKIFLSIHNEKVKNECFAILDECGYNLEANGNFKEFKSDKVFIF